MKHTLLAAALAAALLLAGCAAGSAPVSSSSAPASSAPESAASPASSEAASAPEAEARPAATALPLWIEGAEETVPATLFTGEGYSLYLPDGEWTQTAQASRADCTADVFTAAYNDAVTLRVQPNYNGLLYGDVTLEDAYEALLSSGYSQSDDNDHMFARSVEGTVTCQYVTEADGVVWYVSWSYPDTTEYLEGWGSRLPQIAATFAAQTLS